MTTRTYCVADHSFCIGYPESGLDFREQLLPYAPFEVTDDSNLLFSIELHTTASLPVPADEYRLTCLKEEGLRIWIYRMKGTIYFGFACFAEMPKALVAYQDGCSTHILYVEETISRPQLSNAFTNACMLLYTLHTAQLNTVIIHASAIRQADRSYAFLGQSGTGKSTHSHLWLQHIPGCELLNDDNPVIRLRADGVFIFGSPWSGKTPCYRNLSVSLRALVLLSQAPSNRIERLKPVPAYAALLASCSSIKWDQKISDGIHHTLEKIVARCPIYKLECLPDEEAARLCQQTLQASY